jgi:hypothetical protein
VHEKILFQTESARVWPTLLTTALRTELGTTLVIGVGTHHCQDGLLPLPVAPSQDDSNRANDGKFLPALPRQPGGSTASEALPEETGSKQIGATYGAARQSSTLPILTFLAETREYVWGELRNGDRPDGKQIGKHIRDVCAALPPGVKQIYGRADSGFYCREAVEAYEECSVRFAISARKTSRLVEMLQQAEWKPSKKTDADMECEFRYQPKGWKKGTPVRGPAH